MRVIKYRLRVSVCLFTFLVSLLTGLAASYFVNFHIYWIIWLGLGGLSLTYKSRNLMFLILIMITGLAIGCFRGSAYTQDLKIYQELYYKNVEIVGIALEDGSYNDKSTLAFKVGHININGEYIRGKIDVSGYGANAIYKGDQLLISGKPYPSYGTSIAKINYANIELVSRNPGLIDVIRRKFVAGMQTALPEPLAPFAMGLLVGQRATLPEQIKDDLLHVGLTHIIAVSGYNLTIILMASQRLLAKQSKKLSLGLSVSLIATFLLVTGFSASIVRAAIVSMLSIGLAYYGRRLNPINLILLAAVITALANPLYIWRDISWYLSFLAFFGVVVVSPVIKGILNWSILNSIIGAVALESICAELMTLPYILLMFGQMSQVGLIANVLIVALIPLAMLLGLFAGLAGMLYAPWAGYISWPASILLNYMLDTAHLLANLPGIFIDGIKFGFKQMLVCYFLTALLVTMIWRRNLKNAKITDKEALI